MTCRVQREDPDKNDLRKLIKPWRKPRVEEEEEAVQEVALDDLGPKLKNRMKRAQEPARIERGEIAIRFHEEDSRNVDLRTGRMRSDVDESHRDAERRHRNHRRHDDDKQGVKSRIDRRHPSPIRHRGTMRSDHYEERRRHDETSHKPKSKVAVVIKTQRRPAVASKIWSRMHADVEKTSRGRLGLASSPSETSDSLSNSSSLSSSESSDSGSEDEALVASKFDRPGFKSESAGKVGGKSPLRIEISNDHFKE